MASTNYLAPSDPASESARAVTELVSPWPAGLCTFVDLADQCECLLWFPSDPDSVSHLNKTSHAAHLEPHDRWLIKRHLEALWTF